MTISRNTVSNVSLGSIIISEAFVIQQKVYGKIKIWYIKINLRKEKSRSTIPTEEGRTGNWRWKEKITSAQDKHWEFGFRDRSRWELFFVRKRQQSSWENDVQILVWSSKNSHRMYKQMPSLSEVLMMFLSLFLFNGNDFLPLLGLPRLEKVFYTLWSILFDVFSVKLITSYWAAGKKRFPWTAYHQDRGWHDNWDWRQNGINMLSTWINSTLPVSISY